MTTYPLSSSSSRDEETRRRLRARKVRNFFKGLFSHSIINLVGLFFLIPFLWMVLTAVKSSQDVFHTPPRWLPYDNLTVDVNGEQLPLYNVKTETGVRQLAAVKILEGVGTFVDPANPSQEMQYEIQQGAEKIAEPIMHISFSWRNFPEAMQRGSRPFLCHRGHVVLEYTGGVCLCPDQISRTGYPFHHHPGDDDAAVPGNNDPHIPVL